VTPPFQLASLQNLVPADRIAFQRFVVGPTVRPPAGRIHHAIESWTTNRPHATAVEHHGTAMIYGELDHRAAMLAGTLVGLGVRPGDRVGLFLTRSVPITPTHHLPHVVRTAARHTLATISRNSPVAVSLCKATINAARGQDVATGLDTELAAFRDVFTTPDMREGTAAFLAKRNPKFQA
jgi:non-ribosomal peptide synthetase component F